VSRRAAGALQLSGRLVDRHRAGRAVRLLRHGRGLLWRWWNIRRSGRMVGEPLGSSAMTGGLAVGPRVERPLENVAHASSVTLGKSPISPPLVLSAELLSGRRIVTRLRPVAHLSDLVSAEQLELPHAKIISRSPISVAPARRVDHAKNNRRRSFEAQYLYRLDRCCKSIIKCHLRQLPHFCDDGHERTKYRVDGGREPGRWRLLGEEGDRIPRVRGGREPKHGGACLGSRVTAMWGWVAAVCGSAAAHAWGAG
jgi:hypothetical protein